MVKRIADHAVGDLFFFHHPATTEIYTLSLHDALPISIGAKDFLTKPFDPIEVLLRIENLLDRKSTRLNSSHSQSSYAVFCLKKKRRFEYEGGGWGVARVKAIDSEEAAERPVADHGTCG